MSLIGQLHRRSVRRHLGPGLSRGHQPWRQREVRRDESFLQVLMFSKSCDACERKISSILNWMKWHHQMILHDSAGMLLSWRPSWLKTAGTCWRLWPTILNCMKVTLNAINKQLQVLRTICIIAGGQFCVCAWVCVHEWMYQWAQPFPGSSVPNGSSICLQGPPFCLLEEQVHTLFGESY